MSWGTSKTFGSPCSLSSCGADDSASLVVEAPPPGGKLKPGIPEAPPPKLKLGMSRFSCSSNSCQSQTFSKHRFRALGTLIMFTRFWAQQPQRCAQDEDPDPAGRGVTRGARGTQFPGRQITEGAPNHCEGCRMAAGDAEKSQQCHKYFL